ncbi:hypothetical protein J6V86_00095 [bacterium]|nr:hypothetical protein [bacterium]
MMNQVLTPFSYAFAETGDIFDADETVTIESDVSGDDETGSNETEEANDVTDDDINDVDDTTD